MDVCILEMQFQREYRDACLDGFKGHDAKYMAVIRRLQNTGPKLERLTCLPVPKNKWGCTCGGCLNGHLSPRMHFRSAKTFVTLLCYMDTSVTLLCYQ